MRLHYTIETIDPVIMSQSNATTNNHDSFDFIPGSTVLGAVASKLYRGLAKEQSWPMFHNGQCKFSNCYRVFKQGDKSEIALPTPASWHIQKDNDAVINKQYCQDNVINFAANDFIDDGYTQYCRVELGFVVSTKHKAVIVKDITGKTAINSDTGAAKESQLFNYAYIEAGQTFAGWIDCQSEALEEELKLFLNQTHRMGRSRNAEFGRVKFSLLDKPAVPSKINNISNKLVLWCLSDVELINNFGMPTLRPAGCDIHSALKDATLDVSRSFIRPFCASRFNQKRQGADSEQVLIGMGSLLVFDLPQAIDNSVLQTIEEQGIGANRQQGLGWVCINPAWVSTKNFNENNLFDGIFIANNSSPSTCNDNQPSALLSWVKEQEQNKQDNDNNQSQVTEILQSIVGYYHNARQFAGIGNAQQAGPSSNQWQRLFEIIRLNNVWYEAAFVGEHAICKASNDSLGWGIEWDDQKGMTTFVDAIKNHFRLEQSVDLLRLLLEQLCKFDLSTYEGLAKIAKEYRWEAAK
jgi:CRISPR-associated protein Csx10